MEEGCINESESAPEQVQLDHESAGMDAEYVQAVDIDSEQVQPEKIEQAVMDSGQVQSVRMEPDSVKMHSEQAQPELSQASDYKQLDPYQHCNEFLTLRPSHKEAKLPSNFIKACQNLGLVGRRLGLKLDKQESHQNKEWLQFLPKVQAIYAESFDSTSNCLPELVRVIHRIKFANLKDLFLYENGIQSMQLLYKIEFSNLKNIRIDGNQLTSLKFLRKCYLPNLEQIDLENNEFSDPFWMAQMHAPMLAVVRLEWTSSYPRCDDKSWFGRLQSPILNYIRCPGSRRMKTRAIDEMLGQRYKMLNVMKNNNSQ